MSWERELILHLREKYSDRVFSLKSFEISIDSINVNMIITTGEGAFRVHPRLPELQVWSSIQEGNEFMQRINEIESKHRNDMKTLSEIRTAKEVVHRARLEGRTPRIEDLRLAEIRINRREKTPYQFQVHNIKLREIYNTVVNYKEQIQKQPEIIIPLGDNRPIEISKRLPIRLILKKIN